MSAQPGEELGSERKWFGDDYERNGLFGNTPTRFDELREELKPRGGEAADDLDQQFHPFLDDGKRPPVAMETASTGKTDNYRSKYLPIYLISATLGFITAFNPSRHFRCKYSQREAAEWICHGFSLRTDDLFVS